MFTIKLRETIFFPNIMATSGVPCSRVKTVSLIPHRGTLQTKLAKTFKET
ncbi:hypothetical protein HYC85_014367 [Camellia sinensis]|uniref:Uncharacterized protein n=1 Tax=Camellia sinensis TaxID=4442 RepID=A0A7J7H606_CAMSI|nr:hypothetical protein HYC85_014367 [Camellia sinensis]